MATRGPNGVSGAAGVVRNEDEMTATGFQLSPYLVEKMAIGNRVADNLASRLKPCPFCGGKPRMTLDDGLGAGIQCTECRARCCRVELGGAKSWDRVYQEAAAKLVMAWNRRST